MKKYRVWTYDVWGNASDGYEINDRNELTDYLFSGKLMEVKNDSDNAIIEALKDNGYLKKTVKLKSLIFNGDPETISIEDSKDNYHLFGLELISDTRED